MCVKSLYVSIRSVLANDTQVLIHPLLVPKPMIDYLNGANFSQRRVELLFSIALKILAHVGTNR